MRRCRTSGHAMSPPQIEQRKENGRGNPERYISTFLFRKRRTVDPADELI